MRRLDLGEHAMLELEILEHRLDHEIGRREARVVGRAADEAQVVVELLARDLLLRAAARR